MKRVAFSDGSKYILPKVVMKVSKRAFVLVLPTLVSTTTPGRPVDTVACSSSSSKSNGRQRSICWLIVKVVDAETDVHSTSTGILSWSGVPHALNLFY